METILLEPEIVFVDMFIVPEKRERYKTFLANSKRRKEILQRLYHALVSDLIPSLRTPVHNAQKTVDSVEQMLIQRGAGSVCHVISPDRDIDGKEFTLRQALETIIEDDCEAVVCCIPPRVAFYKPEAPGEACILEKKIPVP